MRGDPNDTLIPQSRDGFEGMTYHEAAFRFWNMCRRVRGASNVDIVYSTTSVLADLIDLLTCSMEYMPEYSGDELYPTESYRCSECGRTCEEIYGRYERCPHCGAEVLDEDSAN